MAGKLFEIFCKYYFLSEPTVKDDYLNVWLYEEIPQAVKEKLNLGSVEHGVDLILEDEEGKYTAVQCKFRNDESDGLSWSKDKIANLFGFAIKADRFAVFTNASELDHVSKERTKQFTFYNISDLLHIDPATFAAIEKLLVGEEPPQVKKFTPHEHQQRAIDAALEHFKTESRGQLIFPCGAGKTVTALWIKEKLGAANTLVLVPSLALLHQIKNDWVKQRARPYKYICVCSEKDISSDQDTTVTHTYEVGGLVTTDPDVVSGFLKGDSEKVIFSTYQSLAVISRALADTSLSFDFMICDEAHKTTGAKTEGFALAHDDKKIPAKIRLYMTATPRVLSASVKKKYGEELDYICDMSNPDIYGSEIYRLSFKEAIDRGILVDYKIIAIGVTENELKDHLDRRRYVSSDESIDEITANYALDMVMEKYKACHAITFHHRVVSAQKFTERHKGLYPSVLTGHVNGSQPTSMRSIVLDAFDRAEQGVISNARCLTEGIDLPSIDMVYFCDPKNSKIDIVQASGRALRTDHSRSKKIGYVVVPIFHREREKVEEAIDSGVFKNVVQVVRSLCDQDERLRAEITKLVFEKGKRDLKKVEFSFSKESQEKVISVIGFEEKLRDALFDQIIEKSVVSWDVQYENLLEFRKKYPDRWPEQRKEFPKGNKLGNWFSHQRKYFKKSQLSEERIELLNKISFTWERDDTWMPQYETLLEFRKKYPDRWPAEKEEFPKGNNLGYWCSNQRRGFKRDLLSKERLELLSKIGFRFSTKTIMTKPWLSQYETLLEFRKKYPDHWPAQKEEFPKGNNLGNWCNSQQHRFRKNKLSQERIRLLNKIGFTWGRDDTWMPQYETLLEFGKKYPDRWPKTLEEFPKGNKLGFWCNTQRQLLKKNQLSKERLELLSKIGFRFSTKTIMTKPWLSQYETLLEFRKKYPDRWPKTLEEFPKGNKLGSWCHVQRRDHKKGLLSKERIELLNKISFTWERDDTWMLQYETLLEFREKYPNHWPAHREEFPKGNKLGLWCHHQRQDLKKGRLSKEQIELLNKIGFSWGSRIEKYPKSVSRPI